MNFKQVELSDNSLLLFDTPNQIGIRFKIIKNTNQINSTINGETQRLIIEPVGLYLDDENLDGFSLKKTILSRQDVRIFFKETKISEKLIKNGIFHSSFFSLLCSYPQLSSFINHQGMLLVIVGSMNRLNEKALLLARPKLLDLCLPEYPPRFMTILKRIKIGDWSLIRASSLLKIICILLINRPVLMEKLLKLEYLSLSRLQLIVDFYQDKLTLIHLVFLKDMESTFIDYYEKDKFYNFTNLLRDIERMEQIVTIKGDYRNIKTIKNLKDYHQRQNEAYNFHQTINSVGITENDMTPTPLIRGTKEIKHVATYGDLYELATDMVNCLISYVELVLNEGIDIYRVTIDDRDYTLTLTRLNRNKGVYFHDLLGKYNKNPPNKVKKIVFSWIHEFAQSK